MKARTKLSALAAGIGLAVSLIAGAAPAQAAPAPTYDRFGNSAGGEYYSTDKHADAANSGRFVKPYYSVQWTKGNKIVVGADLFDNSADGRGPVLKINVISYNSSGTRIGVEETDYLHYTGGSGGNGFGYEQKTLNWPEDRPSAGLDFYMCNGFSSSGAPQYCSAVHGTFRP